MTTANEIKARLESERRRLEQELILLTSEGQADRGLAGGSYATHVADDATDTFDQERAEALARHTRGMLDQVVRAVHKLECGDYGRCDRCGRPIDPARLDALPHATLCLTCQAKQEAWR